MPEGHCQHEWKEKVILRVTLEIPNQDNLLTDVEALLENWKDDIRNRTNCGNLDAADFQAQLTKELIVVVEKYRSKDQ